MLYVLSSKKNNLLIFFIQLENETAKMRKISPRKQGSQFMLSLCASFFYLRSGKWIVRVVWNELSDWESIATATSNRIASRVFAYVCSASVRVHSFTPVKLNFTAAIIESQARTWDIGGNIYIIRPMSKAASSLSSTNWI